MPLSLGITTLAIIGIAKGFLATVDLTYGCFLGNNGMDKSEKIQSIRRLQLGDLLPIIAWNYEPN